MFVFLNFCKKNGPENLENGSAGLNDLVLYDRFVKLVVWQKRANQVDPSEPRYMLSVRYDTIYD